MHDPGLAALRDALAGRYDVQREIGRGGMATVYLARDLELGRRVAIKLLRQEMADSDGSDRFHREMRVTAGLSHPHILPLLVSSHIDGVPFYVMPYVKGESLREKLAREGKLSIDEAIGIALEVADALATAHGHGVVHRDIKPGNILLEAGHAVVADFGIVRMRGDTSSQLTEPGSVLGTPDYESPEQWAGLDEIDGRSDLYSLGCVLYEMLAGEPPYPGSTPHAVAAKHTSAPVPHVTMLRDTVPPAVDAVLQRVLAKASADRFPTASSFAEALKKAARGPRRLGRRWRVLRAAVVVLLALVGAVVVGTSDRVRGFLVSSGETHLDTMRYAILSFDQDAADAPGLDPAQRLGEALIWWRGLGVADPLRVADAEARTDSVRESNVAAARVGRAVAAGRFITGSVTPVGSSLRVSASVHTADTMGVTLASASALVSEDLSGADSVFARLADRLLFRSERADEEGRHSGTRTYSARTAYLAGEEALTAWQLPRADSAFASAAAADPAYAQAHLRLALVRAWRDVPEAQWRVPARQAAYGIGLSPRDRLMADAVVAQAQGDMSRACRLWSDLTEREPLYYAGWYGVAACEALDDVVLPDPGSPSGWRFRTSYHHALQAYRRAFELRPAILGSFRRGSFEALRDLFMTSAKARRAGRGLVPDTTGFSGMPAWVGDSLSLVPYAMAAGEVHASSGASSLEEAVRNLRMLFHDVALTWLAASPQSADASEALSVSLALLGDPEALQTIRRARALVRDEGERIRIAGAEVWMQIAFALPDDEDGLRRARVLADSVLPDSVGAGRGDPLLLASLAALTGRAGLAADFMRQPGVAERIGVPVSLRESAPALLIYSALGAPADTLEALEDKVRTGIDGGLLPAERGVARLRWLARPATLSFSSYRSPTLEEPWSRQDYVLGFQADFAAGDTAAVRAGLEEIRRLRADLLPASLTLDSLVPEAELFYWLRDHDAAIAWLDPTLRTLPHVAPDALTDPVLAAALARAILLRAALALEVGDDEGARQWQSAGRTLWSDADPSLRPRLREPRRLSG